MTDRKSGAASPGRFAIPGLGRLYAGLEADAWLLVRVALGAPLVFHGTYKLASLFGIGLETPAGFFATTEATLGPLLTYSLAMLEVVAGILVVVGFGTRVAALMIALFMAGAVVGHLPAGFFWTGGGYEYPLVLLLLSIAVTVRGGGKRSVDRSLPVEI